MKENKTIDTQTESDQIDRSVLSLAAEYATASALCRRNFYVQLTLGNLKRTDLLLYAERRGQLARIEVKAKQGQVWPACRGISGRNSYLVFVDFFKKRINEQPDFCILRTKNWNIVAKRLISKYRRHHAGQSVKLIDGIATFPVNNGKPWRGIMVKVADIAEHRGKWSRFPRMLTAD